MSARMQAQGASAQEGAWPTVGTVTLSAACAEYVLYLQATGRPQTTVQAVRSCLHLFSLYTSPVSIADAATKAIPFLAERSQTRKRNTQAVTFSHLKTFFVFCLRYGWLERNPLADLNRPRQEQIVTQPLSDREIVALYAAASPWQRAAIVVMLGSGMRIGELAALRWQDIRDGYVVVHGKGDRERTLAPGRTGMAALYQMPHKGERVFPCTYGSMKVGLAKLSRVADVKMHPHQFRHSFSHRFLDAGGTIEELSEILGHARLDTTMVYVRAFRRERALEAMRAYNPADALFKLDNNRGQLENRMPVA
jgi:site-specific recombinase XerD